MPKKNHWLCHAFCFDYPVDNAKAGEYLLEQLNHPEFLHREDFSVLKPSWRLTPALDGGIANSLAMVNSIIKKNIDTPDVILATGPHFNNFLTGCFLARFYRAKLVLDYRDEWSLCPFEWVEKSKFSRKVEKWLCKKADKIIFTTQSHMDNHQCNFSQVSTSKYCLVANGFEEKNVTNAEAKNMDKKYCSISFVGVLSDHSLPEDSLNNLEKIFENNNDILSSLRINFIGNKSEKAEALLKNFKYPQSINVIAHVSKNEAVDLMSRSDGLLILAGKGMKGYIPGKLFDYLSINKPIVYFGEQGEASGIVDKLNVGFSIDGNDIGGLESALLTIVKDELVIDNRVVNDWLKNYTRSHLAEKLYLELTNLIGDMTIE
jgi:hypothetical protein